MAKSSVEKYPRITPLRALTLLREMDYRQGHRVGAGAYAESALDSGREALANHVRAALTSKGRRR